MGGETEILLRKTQRGVSWLTLNRPQVHNAFNDQLIAEIKESFDQLSRDDSLRAVVLDARGSSFCAGADLHWMKRMVDYSREENYRDSLCLAEMFEAIDRCPVPVLARVRGAALGGGVGLLAACDYVLMTSSAQWGLTEVHLGLVPAVISTWVIQKMGWARARGAFLTGARYDGERAFAWGLADEVFPSEQSLDDRLEKLLEGIRRTGPRASRMAKELSWLQRTFEGRPEKLKDLTCQMIATQRVSEEGQEGMKAFLSKRNPKWLEGEKSL